MKQLNLYAVRTMASNQHYVNVMEALIRELDRRVNNPPPGYTRGLTNAEALGDLGARNARAE